MYSNRVAIAGLALALGVVAGVRPVEAANCSISTTPVVFGTYNVFTTTPEDSTGTVVYRCNGNAGFIWITMTRGSSGTYEAREMAGGSDRLEYNLYRDAARTVIWGNLTGGTSPYYDLDPPRHRDVSVTVYGRIPPGQDVRAGSYSDTVSLEINF